MKTLRTLMALSLILFTTKIFSQDLPDSYQAIFNEIVTNFKSIRGSNSITQGKTTLNVINDNKVALRMEYKKEVKNLTFETKPDGEKNLVWVAVNQQTIDMVNKHEDFLTRELETMLKYSEKRAKE